MVESLHVLENVELPSVHLVGALLFFIECYHIFGHVCVLFRVRMLPRKDLVRVRLYFLFDTLTVFVVAFLYTGQLRWLAVLQMIQHLFFFFTWNEHTFTKRVISWSSLDWQRSPLQAFYHWDMILGTAFDVVVHMLNACILASYLSTVEVIVAGFLSQASGIAILYNSRYAWSSPSYIPDWVQQRIEPIEEKLA